LTPSLTNKLTQEQESNQQSPNIWENEK